MSIYHSLTGIVLLVAAGAGLWLAVPRQGQLSAVGRSNVLGELLTLGIIVSLAFGSTFLVLAFFR